LTRSSQNDRRQVPDPRQNDPTQLATLIMIVASSAALYGLAKPNAVHAPV